MANTIICKSHGMISNVCIADLGINLHVMLDENGSYPRIFRSVMA